MSDKFHHLQQALTSAVMWTNGIVAATDLLPIIALGSLIAMFLLGTHVTWMTWMRLREIRDARQVLTSIRGQADFFRHFEAISARLLTFRAIKSGWEHLLQEKVFTTAGGNNAALSFSIAPSRVFTRGTVIPQWQRLDKIPLYVLYVALVSAIVGLAISLTQILIHAPGPSNSASHGLRAAQQMADAGSASFAVIIAGIIGASIASLVMQICGKRIDLALAGFVRELDQRVTVRSFGNAPLDAAEPEHINVRLSQMQGHVEASVSKVEASLQRAINQAFSTIVQQLDAKAASAAGTIKDNTDIAFNSRQQLINDTIAKFYTEVSNRNDVSIGALNDKLSAPLSATLSRVDALAETVAGTRSELRVTSTEMQAQINSVAHAIEKLRQQQSDLMQTSTEVQRSALIAIADIEQQRSAANKLSDAEQSIFLQFSDLRSLIDQLREERAINNSIDTYESGKLENRLRIELASLRLALRQQSNESAASQKRAIDQLLGYFDEQLEQRLSKPLTELTALVDSNSAIATRSTVEIVELGKKIVAGTTDVAESVSEARQRVDAALAAISNDIKSGTVDARTEYQRFSTEAVDVLAALNQAVARIEKLGNEGATQLTRSVAVDLDQLRRQAEQAVVSLQTEGELSRIKLEEAIGKLTTAAGTEIEHISNDIAGKLKIREDAHAKQIGELRDHIAAGVDELKGLVLKLDQPARFAANETTSSRKNSSFHDTPLDVGRAARTATDEISQKLNLSTCLSDTGIEQTLARVGRLSQRISEDLQMIPVLLKEADPVAHKPTAAQTDPNDQVAVSYLPMSAQLEETLIDLASDLRQARSMMLTADADRPAMLRTSVQGPRLDTLDRRRPDENSSGSRRNGKLGTSDHQGSNNDSIKQTISQFFVEQRMKKEIV